MTNRQIRPFLWTAWVGVATTALNTLIPALLQTGSFAGISQAMQRFRDIVLLVHAPATWLPLLGLAILSFRERPFTAVTVIAFTSAEKLIELVGQALQVFPPSEVFGNVQAHAIVSAIWGQMFFLLWLCNTVAATAAGLLMFRLARGRLRIAALALAWVAGLLTLTMILGPDYVGWRIAGPSPLFFFLIFTGYRTVIALTLAQAERQQLSGQFPG